MMMMMGNNWIVLNIVFTESEGEHTNGAGVLLRLVRLVGRATEKRPWSTFSLDAWAENGRDLMPTAPFTLHTDNCRMKCFTEYKVSFIRCPVPEHCLIKFKGLRPTVDVARA